MAEFRRQRMLSCMNLGSICNRDVVIATPAETLRDAGRSMIEHNVGSVVVCEDRDGARRPIGILTDRDLMIALLGDGAAAACIAIGDAMTRDPLVLHDDEAIEDAAERLRAHAVRRAPVVDARGALVGIVAIDDLIDLLAEELDGISRLIKRQLRARSPDAPRVRT